MSGYMMVLGSCWSCGAMFTFNAERVPSIMVEGRREPVCENCMALANEKRREMGLEPHLILPGAYEAEQV